jgi:dTDP-4-dehydrorhamnose reductase
MKVLVTGCHGQVGIELMALAKAYGHEVIGFDHDTLDITDEQAVQACMQKEQPDVLINAAAYTAVDKAEEDKSTAKAVNATAVGYLAQACKALDIPLVHISTDYVFDGSKEGAYVELDAISPLGIYGGTKLEGEALVQRECEKYYIFRTSWVFSAHGNNFVKTMLRLGAEREELGIVADQRGKPTSAREIARVIYEALASHKNDWGIYHLAQPNAVTWFDFAQNIFNEAKQQGLPLRVKRVNAITTADFPTPAKRPGNSELDCNKLEITFDLELKPWRESLAEVIKDLKNE